MCGIAGFWGAPDAALLATMTRRIEHRGPDGEGFFEHDVASLGHRRLAIIDPARGHQPLGAEDGLVQLTYNGEVYNFRELRSELEALGHVFHTSCDTEVVLHAYSEWGTDCFARFNGMWALAILDVRAAPRLVLAHDHFGIKPLYWARSPGGRVLFASEAKAVLADPGLAVEPDRQWLYDYLLHGLHDHKPETAFAGLRALPAATWAVVDEDGVHEERYWEPELARDAPNDPATFRTLFTRSVERRLVADVPAGTCLSGGIDSSSIVKVSNTLLAEHVPDSVSLGERLKTFSIVYAGDPIDEREYMEAVLDEVDAEPHFAEPTSEEFVEELDRVVWHQDEPIVSTGPYAQWCVMRLAQPSVTVLLNGQGGDELLAGYVPYQYVYLRELLRERRLGVFVREAWESRDVLRPLVARRLSDRRRALPIGPLLRPEFSDGLQPPRFERSQDDLKRRLVADLQTFSLPSLLRYEDRNSMAFSMESRLPFLDQELVDWVLRLPSDAIVDRGWSCAVLRQGLRGVLTEKVRTRRWKVGFTTPETRWLRARRAVIQGVFRSPQFCAWPYWDAPALADSFDRFCAGEVEPSQIFWRALEHRDLASSLLRRPRLLAARSTTGAAASPGSVTNGWPRGPRVLAPRSRVSSRTPSAISSLGRTPTGATTHECRYARACSSQATTWPLDSRTPSRRPRSSPTTCSRSARRRSRSARAAPSRWRRCTRARSRDSSLVSWAAPHRASVSASPRRWSSLSERRAHRGSSWRRSRLRSRNPSA